jgi:hypothetical protein
MQDSLVKFQQANKVRCTVLDVPEILPDARCRRFRPQWFRWSRLARMRWKKRLRGSSLWGVSLSTLTSKIKGIHLRSVAIWRIDL